MAEYVIQKRPKQSNGKWRDARGNLTLRKARGLIRDLSLNEKYDWRIEKRPNARFQND